DATLLVSCFMIRRPQIFTLFPYTPLFRSGGRDRQRRLSAGRWDRDHQQPALAALAEGIARGPRPAGRARDQRLRGRGQCGGPPRSEEHTSELQSRENLVCRLLLEKKKIIR